MAYTTKAAEYLRGSGATNDEIDDIFDFWSAFKDGGKRNRYEVYRLWARLLSHRQTSYKKHGIFDFHNDLKWYLFMECNKSWSCRWWSPVRCYLRWLRELC